MKYIHCLGLWLTISGLTAQNLYSDDELSEEDLNFQEQAADFVFASANCTFDPATQSCINIPGDGVNPGNPGAQGIVRTGRFGYGPYNKYNDNYGNGYWGRNQRWGRSHYGHNHSNNNHRRNGWHSGAHKSDGGRHNGHGTKASRGGKHH